MCIRDSSKPIPVSTCLSGNDSSFPFFDRLNWMNTLFHISITVPVSSLFTNEWPSLFAFGRLSKCISVQGPHGPVSPISQKLSFLLPINILSSGIHFFHSLYASSSLGNPSFSSPSKMVTYNLSLSNPYTLVNSSQLHSIASFLK